MISCAEQSREFNPHTGPHRQYLVLSSFNLRQKTSLFFPTTPSLPAPHPMLLPIIIFKNNLPCYSLIVWIHYPSVNVLISLGLYVVDYIPCKVVIYIKLFTMSSQGSGKDVSTSSGMEDSIHSFKVTFYEHYSSFISSVCKGMWYSNGILMWNSSDIAHIA